MSSPAPSVDRAAFAGPDRTPFAELAGQDAVVAQLQRAAAGAAALLAGPGGSGGEGSPPGSGGSRGVAPRGGRAR